MSCGTCGGGCVGSCTSNPCAPGFALPVPGVGPQDDPTLRSGLAQPTPLCGTLARGLIGVADSLRNLYAAFGLRPYVVRLIKTRWSGGRRGVGAEYVTSDVPLLPVPLVSDISSLSEIVTPAGLDEFGEVALTQLSGAYTEDFLRGHDPEGRPASVDEQVYYEIEFPPPCTGADGERRRFLLRGAPHYQADAFGWTVRLERARQDRARNGDPR